MSQLALKAYLVAVALIAIFFVSQLPDTNVSVLDADLWIGVLMVFGPWLLGGFLGHRWGRAWPGLAAALALGPVLSAASVASFLLLLGSSPDAACGEDECLDIAGRWIEGSLAVQWPLYATIAWTLSVVLFSTRVRRSRRTSALT